MSKTSECYLFKDGHEAVDDARVVAAGRHAGVRRVVEADDGPRLGVACEVALEPRQLARGWVRRCLVERLVAVEANKVHRAPVEAVVAAVVGATQQRRERVVAEVLDVRQRVRRVVLVIS